MNDAISDTVFTGIDNLIPLHELTKLRSSRRGKHLHVATLYRWAATGRLPTVKIGGSRYVRANDLERLLAGQTGAPSLTSAPPPEAARSAGRQLEELFACRRSR